MILQMIRYNKKGVNVWIVSVAMYWIGCSYMHQEPPIYLANNANISIGQNVRANTSHILVNTHSFPSNTW